MLQLGFCVLPFGQFDAFWALQTLLLSQSLDTESETSV